MQDIKQTSCVITSGDNIVCLLLMSPLSYMFQCVMKEFGFQCRYFFVTVSFRLLFLPFPFSSLPSPFTYSLLVFLPFISPFPSLLFLSFLFFFPSFHLHSLSFFHSVCAWINIYWDLLNLLGNNRSQSLSVVDVHKQASLLLTKM